MSLLLWVPEMHIHKAVMLEAISHNHNQATDNWAVFLNYLPPRVGSVAFVLSLVLRCSCAFVCLCSGCWLLRLVCIVASLLVTFSDMVLVGS